MELKRMKCPSCGGELTIPDDKDEMKCEFCGSKVIIDDKATEVNRIKKAEIKAKKELDEHELENRKKNDDYNDEREYKKKKSSGKLKGWAIALTIISLLFTFVAFKDGKILSGVIGIIQVIAFGYASLLCLDVFPEKIKNLHKIIFIVGCILIIPFFSLGAVKLGDSSDNKEKAEDIAWSEFSLSEKLPEPKTLKGRLNYDSADSLSLYIMGVSKDEYKEYVSACKEMGYTVDAYNSSTSFRAQNGDGYSLNLFYDEDDKEYSITLRNPSEEETPSGGNSTPEEPDTPTTDTNGLRPEFKKAMDDYEAFINEYVEFMKKYIANPTDMTLLNNYADYLNKYTAALESFEKWDDADMNVAEANYYLEVQSRVLQKLAEVQ